MGSSFFNEQIDVVFYFLILFIVIKFMKKNNNSSTLWLRILVIINTLAVASYIFYGEWQKKQPRMVKHVCQTVAADQEKGLIALTCLED